MLVAEEEEPVAEQDVVPRHERCTNVVEVERRKGAARDLLLLEKKVDVAEAKLDKRMDDQDRHIGGLLTFKNRSLGTVLLGVVIILGSYSYTAIHSANAEVKYTTYDSEIKQLTEKLSNVRLEQARTDERYNSFSLQLGLINSRLERLMALVPDKINLSHDRED